MFGYITVYKPELKMKDFYKYKAYYCGLCRVLKEKYGITGQMTLTYDMTFAIILLTSLYESETIKSEHRCIVHPAKKHEMLQNEMTEYAADMNVMLAYYHFVDDWKDEKAFSGLFGSSVLRKKVKKIIDKYPRQSRTVRVCLKELAQCEAEGSADLDKVAGCFGKLMSGLMVLREDQWEKNLKRLGFFLGKFIYIMDAYDDLEKDIKKGNYNPLKNRRGNDNFEEECRQILVMMMGECSREFEKLPCLIDSDILNNIIYAGVWERYNKLLKERKEQ